MRDDSLAIILLPLHQWDLTSLLYLLLLPAEMPQPQQTTVNDMSDATRAIKNISHCPAHSEGPGSFCIQHWYPLPSPVQNVHSHCKVSFPAQVYHFLGLAYIKQETVVLAPSHKVPY